MVLDSCRRQLAWRKRRRAYACWAYLPHHQKTVRAVLRITRGACASVPNPLERLEDKSSIRTIAGREVQRI